MYYEALLWNRIWFCKEIYSLCDTRYSSSHPEKVAVKGVLWVTWIPYFWEISFHFRKYEVKVSTTIIKKVTAFIIFCLHEPLFDTYHHSKWYQAILQLNSNQILNCTFINWSRPFKIKCEFVRFFSLFCTLAHTLSILQKWQCSFSIAVAAVEIRPW